MARPVSAPTSWNVPGVEQRVDALADRQLALRVVALDLLRAAHPLRELRAARQLLELGLPTHLSMTGAHRGRLPVAAAVLPCVVVRGDRALGDAHQVDLVGAVGEARPAGVLEHVGERRVLRVAERAVHLDRAVDDAVERVGDEVLRHRHLALEVFLAVDLVGRVQHHELALVQLHRRVGDHPLDALLLGEQRAVRVAVERAVDHHVERDLGLRDPAHAVREARRPEPVLAEQVALAAAAEHLVVVHAQVLDADLGVAAGAVHRLDLAHLGPAVLREVDDERGVRGLRDVGVVLGARDEDREAGAVRVADEPLVAVDDPLVAVGVTPTS